MTDPKGKPPTPEQIKAARRRAKLSLAQAAALVNLSAAPRWAEYESGRRNMDYARWRLFLLLTGQHPKAQLINGMIVIPAKEAT
jgi:DNA-binding transcriptional regulator YiaG